jgi:hypothetical protein
MKRSIVLAISLSAVVLAWAEVEIIHQNQQLSKRPYAAPVENNENEAKNESVDDKSDKHKLLNLHFLDRRPYTPQQNDNNN